MPQIMGRVGEGQDPEARIQNVIDACSWILPDDMPLVLDGKAQIIDRIDNENWEPPYIWNIKWVNIPPSDGEQSLDVGIIEEP